MAPSHSRVRAAGGNVGATRAYTVGHGTLAAEDFEALLRSAGIAGVADIRTVPRSRRNPQYATEAMREWLRGAGIAYRHYQALGGWRRPRPDSPNIGLRHPAFRGYADYMLTEEFAQAVDALVPQLESRPTALMCSESVWWRCHRKLLADYLVLVRGLDIYDLMHDGRAPAHVLTPGARLSGRQVLYDAVE
jgi:uncharacterized protein (DUF488 family)